MKQLCNKIFLAAFFWRKIPLIFLFTLVLCCRQTPQPLSPPELFARLSEEIQLPLTRDNAAARLNSLENLLDQGIKVAPTSLFSARQRSALLAAIARYQIYYIISPNRQRYDKLPIYYRFFDQCEGAGPISNEFRQFKELRQSMTAVINRNNQAQLRLQQFMCYLQARPQVRKNFFSQLVVADEVGGVIFYSQKQGIGIRFIHDKRRDRYRQYWRQFKSGDFRNLERLERIAVQRFLLQKVGADASTLLYNRVVLKIIVRCFATIKTLAARENLTPEQSRQVALAQKKLLALGLEKRLIRRSYFLDPYPYLSRPDTVFFFHSHPLRPGPKYQKRPSGQDKRMTFRTGPALVFDIQENYVDLYAVVRGESQRAARYYQGDWLQKK